jgi:hypothetical protein
MRLSASKAALKFFSGPESFPASQDSTASFRMPMAVAAVTRHGASAQWAEVSNAAQGNRAA